LEFESVSAIGQDGKLKASTWKEQRKWDTVIQKSVCVLEPLLLPMPEVMYQNQGTAIISICMKNVTATWNYLDKDLPEKPKEIEGSEDKLQKGMNILIEDIQADIKKSLVYDLNEGTNLY
jgi:hypothetical protein